MIGESEGGRIAHRLKALDAAGIGAWAPALGDSDWVESAVLSHRNSKECRSQIQGKRLPPGPFVQLVGRFRGIVAEDDVVNRDAQIKAAAFVEVDHFVD